MPHYLFRDLGSSMIVMTRIVSPHLGQRSGSVCQTLRMTSRHFLEGSLAGDSGFAHDPFRRQAALAHAARLVAVVAVVAHHLRLCPGYAG